MSEKPDFRELVGDDVSGEERARLERVHDLLVAAGPPAELPPSLATPEPDLRDEGNLAFLPRRRTGLLLGLAAALALTAFLGGFVAGRTRDAFPEAGRVAMHGTAQTAAANAVIRVGTADAAGNWPLQVSVHGLKPLPRGEYYEMFLTRDGKRVATCGTFRTTDGDSVVLNAPYDLRRFSGWVVTREKPGSNRHPVVLRTAKV